MSRPFAAKGAGACLSSMFSPPGLGRGAFASGGVHYGPFLLSLRARRRRRKAVALNPPASSVIGASEAAASNRFSASAIELLYRRQASRLRGYLSRRLGRDEADDLLQDSFLKLVGAKPLGSPVDCPEAFVTAIARNALRDRARAAARQAIQLRQLAGDADRTPDDPHRLSESRESLRAIEHALGDMNPRRRRIFLLHRFDDLTYAEIGEAVGMSEKGVKKQMAKALVELRNAVERPA